MASGMVEESEIIKQLINLERREVVGNREVGS